MGNTSSKSTSSLSAKLKLSAFSSATKNGEKFNYQMKIIIRGEEGVGKTCLFHRLMGLTLDDNYVKSTQINTGILPWKIANPASIHPDLPSEEMNVGLEFWDVIDKSNPSDQLPSLIQNSSKSSSTLASRKGKNINLMDAESIDVYDGAHAVILVLDITEDCHTYYIQSQLKRIPSTLPILVFGNFADRQQQRKILPMQIKTLFPRSHELNNLIWYSEGSILQGSGLKIFKSFIKLAFYQYQHQLLKEKLSLVTGLMHLANEEIQKNMSDQDILQLTSSEMDSQLKNMPSFVAGFSLPSDGNERKTVRPMSPIISSVDADEVFSAEQNIAHVPYESGSMEDRRRSHPSIASNETPYDDKRPTAEDLWGEPDPWRR